MSQEMAYVLDCLLRPFTLTNPSPCTVILSLNWIKTVNASRKKEWLSGLMSIVQVAAIRLQSQALMFLLFEKITQYS